MTLGGLALQTSRVRLGTLVTAATFRLPGPLAISVAQVDQMSGGRVEFGFGTGWYEAEHTAYGIPFPSLKERFGRFEEQLAIITGLWETPEGQTFSYDGTLLSAGGFTRAAQARPAAAAAGYSRRRRAPPHPAPGGAVRGRVQPGVPGPGNVGGVQPGQGRLHRGRPGAGLDPAVRGEDGVSAARTTPRWRGAPRRSGGGRMNARQR